jgi:hypothetical protein
MTSKYLATVVLMVVFAWSAVMAALGQVAAVGALVPSLVLLLQQAVQALGGKPQHGDPAAWRPGPAAGPAALHVDDAAAGPPDHTGAGVAEAEGARW